MIGQLRLQFQSDLKEILSPKKQFKIHSLKEVAEMTGISFRTLQRYQLNETKPSLKNITRFYKAYKKLNSDTQNQSSNSADILTPEISSDGTFTSMLLRMIKSKEIITSSWINREYGINGVAYLEILKNSGYIREENKIISIDQKSLPLLIKTIIRSKNIESELSLFNCFVIQVNQQGKERISNLLEKFNLEFSTILKSSIYKGDECYFFTHVAGKF